MLMNLIDFDMDIQQAISAPRIAFMEPRFARGGPEPSQPPPSMRANRARICAHTWTNTASATPTASPSSTTMRENPVRFTGGADPRSAGRGGFWVLSIARSRESTMEIRAYEKKDANEIVHLFHETVHSVNRSDYSREQVEAWAPGRSRRRRVAPAHGRRAKHSSQSEEGGVVGFAELEEMDTWTCSTCGVIVWAWCRAEFVSGHRTVRPAPGPPPDLHRSQHYGPSVFRAARLSYVCASKKSGGGASG